MLLLIDWESRMKSFESRPESNEQTTITSIKDTFKKGKFTSSNNLEKS